MYSEKLKRILRSYVIRSITAGTNRRETLARKSAGRNICRENLFKVRSVIRLQSKQSRSDAFELLRILTFGV